MMKETLSHIVCSYWGYQIGSNLNRTLLQETAKEMSRMLPQPQLPFPLPETSEFSLFSFLCPVRLINECSCSVQVQGIHNRQTPGPASAFSSTIPKH